MALLNAYGYFSALTIKKKKEFILEWSNSPIFIFDCRTAVTRLQTLETCFVIKGTTKVTKTALCVLLVYKQFVFVFNYGHITNLTHITMRLVSQNHLLTLFMLYIQFNSFDDHVKTMNPVSLAS